MKKEVAKLNKIAGQINGLAKMITREEDCEKIIIQFQAAKGALNGVFSEVLATNLARCLRQNRSNKLKSILKQIVKK